MKAFNSPNVTALMLQKQNTSSLLKKFDYVAAKLGNT